MGTSVGKQHHDPNKIDELIQSRYNKEWKQSLNLSKCFVYSCGCIDTWIQVLEQKKWGKLQQLILNDCAVNDGQLRYLLEKKWPSLTILWINKNKITSVGLISFINIKVPQLKILSLGSNLIGNKGIAILVKADLKRLEQLWLYNCGIQVMGARTLTKGNWPQLQTLSLQFNYLSHCIEAAILEVNFQKLSKYYFGKISPTISLIQILTMKPIPMFFNKWNMTSIEIEILRFIQQILSHKTISP